MEEVLEEKKRGRKKGSIEKPTIKDPELSPFYIQVEESSFTVFKENEASAWGYYGSLALALKQVVQFKLSIGKEKTFSLSGYITQYENSINKLLTTIKF